MNLQSARIIALAVFSVWAGLSFVTPVLTTDVWTNFRLGEDLLAGHGFPTLETYSATAEGRPFIAYEWLSAVIFASIRNATDSYGLVALRVVVGLTCLGLLYFSLPALARQRAPLVVGLMLSAHLLCFRTYVRPNLFSLLAAALVVLAIERWRRSRRIAELVWLIPVFALWANLHGAYLFGVVLLGGVAGTALVGAAFPALVRDGDRPFRWSDALGVGSVALGCFGACFINPYGFDLVKHAFRMSESSEYIKATIWEWKSPFETGDGTLWLAIYCSVMILLWASALWRLRDRQWLDVALALIVTILTVRANRFVPYAAIVGFPIVLRAVQNCWERGVGVEWRRASWGLYGAAVVFMLATSVGPASSYSPRGPRPLGFGYSQDLALEEVAYMRAQGFEGVIYNEYFDGSLIIHSLHPTVRPVMDSRIDVYGAGLFREFRASHSTPERFERYVNKYSVTLLLLDTVPKNTTIFHYLWDDESVWTLEKKFEDRALYRRRLGSDRVGGRSAPAQLR